ncbi:hypothetical protein SCYAM73S_01327 [Streptomyces cyaneofuscatus]
MSDARGWEGVAAAIGAWPSVAVVNRRGRTPSGPLTSTYSLRAEVEDLGVVLDAFPGTEALFGWSYGGLIALLAAGERPLPHVIAYEPVIRPFGLDVLPDLRAAEEAGDLDAVVGIVHRRIAGLDAAVVEALRADREGWEALRRLAGPACAELAALNGDAVPEALAGRADRVDLIVGELNRGRAPYGRPSRRSPGGWRAPRSTYSLVRGMWPISRRRGSSPGRSTAWPPSEPTLRPLSDGLRTTFRPLDAVSAAFSARSARRPDMRWRADRQRLGTDHRVRVRARARFPDLPVPRRNTMTTSISDPVVERFVAAVNAGDETAFTAVLTEDATMSDDGSERDLAAWTEKEIFSPKANGRMDVVQASDDGRTLVVDYTNDTWGTMRTRWSFTVTGDRISRFETGQAPA